MNLKHLSVRENPRLVEPHRVRSEVIGRKEKNTNTKGSLGSTMVVAGVMRHRALAGPQVLMYTCEASGRDVICDVNNFRDFFGQGEEEGVEDSDRVGRV